MNKLLVMAAARWAAQGVVAFLLGHNLIAASDAAGWNTTFVNFFLAVISISLLVWTVIQNRWPNLVKITANLPQVDKVALNRGIPMTEAMKNDPSVVVSVNRSTNG